MFTSQQEIAVFVRKYIAAKHELERLEALKGDVAAYVLENGAANKTGKSVQLFAAEHKIEVRPTGSRVSYAAAVKAIKAKYPAIAEDIDAIVNANTSNADGYTVSIK